MRLDSVLLDPVDDLIVNPNKAFKVCVTVFLNPKTLSHLVFPSVSNRQLSLQQSSVLRRFIYSVPETQNQALLEKSQLLHMLLPLVKHTVCT